MSFEQKLNDEWVLTLERDGDMAVARLVGDDNEYELITQDTRMLDLHNEGYEIKLRILDDGTPWVIWDPADNGSLFAWVCPYGTAMWSDNVSIDG